MNQEKSQSLQKILSLKHLKELITEVFDGKFKHDRKCIEVGAPLETME